MAHELNNAIRAVNEVRGRGEEAGRGGGARWGAEEQGVWGRSKVGVGARWGRS